jgi:predicted nucleotidyltransferase
MDEPGAPVGLARRLADRFSTLDGVVAVALGGSVAFERSDAGSDVDLYVYGSHEPALEERSRIAAGSPRAEIGNRFFESGDEWMDAATGIHVDVMYRDPRWIEDQLDRVLVRHEASVGYSTAFWHSVRASTALFDPSGWYARLQERAAAPYPEELVRAVIAKSHPLLRQNLSSFLRQLEKAVARGDRVSVNHRTAAFLASAFDVLFALNRVPHPGEKRLLALVEELCPRRPPALTRDVEAVLAAAADPGDELVRRVDALGADIDRLLDLEGLLPAPAARGAATNAGDPSV